MRCGERFKALLAADYAHFRIVPHREEVGARRVAAAARVPCRQLAKVLVLRAADGEYLMVALPADRRLDLVAVEKATARERLRLATEEELGGRFGDCELGAMPPFGVLYRMPLYVDACFRRDREIFFRAGNHRELVAMRFDDYERIARPVVGQWCFHRAPTRTAPRRRREPQEVAAVPVA